MSKPYKVLLVEDEPLIAMLYEDILLGSEFEMADVRLCNRDALESLEAERPDLAIVDYNLSDGACLPVARRLRELSIPFIVASGLGDTDDPNLGGARWLVKPFTDNQVLIALREAAAEIRR